MINFKHIVITRFNLPQRWKSDKQGNEILNSIWLEERFDLFENFCLPSMISQTCKNFEWWVFFDENTDKLYKSRIEAIELSFKNFKPKFERTYDEFESNLPIRLKKEVTVEKVNWLITTRLDNDDMLAKDTIAALQKGIDFKAETLLEIPWGYTIELNSTPKPKLRRFKLDLNPFISFVERVEKEKVIKSVYFHEHTEWRDVDSIIVSKRPQWAQVIHNKNLFNRISGELVSPLNFNSRFIFNSKYLRIKTDYKLLTKQVLSYLKIKFLIK